MERSTRRDRQAKPSPDNLEDRRLLNARTVLPNGTEINDKDLRRLVLQRQNDVPLPDRQISYKTRGGADVTLRLFGAGSLAGTTVGPDGRLNLIYDDTNASSVIRGRVTGRAPRADLFQVRDADVSIDSTTGIGGNQLARLDLRGFRLADNGRINLLGGVGRLELDSVGRNTQILLRDVPGLNGPEGESAATSTSITTGTNITGTAGTSTTTTGTTGSTNTGNTGSTTTGTAGGTTTGTTTTTAGSGTTTTGTTGTGPGVGTATGPGSTAGTTGGTGTTGGGTGTTGGTGTGATGGTGSTTGGTTNTGGTVPTTGSGSTAATNPTNVGTTTGGDTSTTVNTGTTTTGTTTTTTTTPGGTSTADASTSAGTAGTFTNSGRTLTYVTTANGGVELSAVSGQFAAGPTQEATLERGQPGVGDAPAGIIVNIGRIAGAPRGNSPLGNAQIYAYDPVADALIRFDTAAGTALQTIPLDGDPSAVAGVGLARADGRLLVLAGKGQGVQAFDAATGVLVGGFNVADLAGSGLQAVDGIGTSGNRTVLTDSKAGVIAPINVGASIANGRAVAAGQAFRPGRAFEISGGATGVAGTGSLYVTGAARFDTFQPDQTQFGVLTLGGVAAGNLRETSRTALSSPSSNVAAGPPGTASANPVQALGSVESLLALDTGAANGVNTLTLYNPSTLASRGTLTLNAPNRLAGLSESFHPELVDAALIDVQGNIQSFRADSANGLVLNDSGNLNLLEIGRASNSSVVGQPVGHVAIRRRSNVTITSTARTPGTRGEVIVRDDLRQIGPLLLP